MPGETTAPLTVYFDGACPLCSREIAMYRRQAGASAIAWVDASACSLEALGDGLSRGDALARLHVRTADGDLASGASAFATLWCHLPRLAAVGRVLRLRPLLALAEPAYRLFLVLRRAWRRPARAR